MRGSHRGDRGRTHRHTAHGARPRRRAYDGARQPSWYGYATRRFTHPLYTDDLHEPGGFARGPGRERDRRAEEGYREFELARDTDPLWATPSHRRRREPRRPWTGDWNPDEWWHVIGPERRADYGRDYYEGYGRDYYRGYDRDYDRDYDTRPGRYGYR